MKATRRDFPVAGHVPRDHPTLVPKLPREGEHRPKFLPSDVVEGGRYRWPKPDSIPKKASVLRSDSEYHRVHVVGLCGALSAWRRVPVRGSLRGMTISSNPYRGFRFPREVIEHAVWLYHCFS